MENEHKGFGLSTWAVKNRKTVFLITLIIFLGGLGAYQSMPNEQFPEIKIPEIYVGIAKPGSSPEYMSEKIVKLIEKECAGLNLLDEINSNSVHGYSTIRIKFDFKIKVEDALQKVKDAVDKARADVSFPELPVEPNIFEMDPTEIPILNLNLRGPNSKILKDVAEELEDLIEDLPEISEVDIRGIQTQEMRIDVDPIRSQAVNVTLSDIENAVNSEHQTIPGGEVLMDGMRKSLRVEGEFKTAGELGNIIVKQDEYLPVKLSDIADVYFGNGDTTSFAREFGDPVVMLDIKKQGGKNLLEAAEKIDNIIEEAKESGIIPNSITISKTGDQSNNTREMVSNLENSIIFGIVLVVGVLLFFLGLRNAMFVGIAIPLSMFMSFLILDAMGVTLNTMVLFSLVIALGMLVDNGIVIVENIYRHLDEGLERVPAVIKGVGEVAWPIIASTATTVAAFIPLAVWPGIMGEFMKYLPITLMIVLSSSLFVALVINPVLAVAFMKATQNKPRKKVAVITSLIMIGLGLLFAVAGIIAFGNFLIFIGIMVVLNFFFLYPATIKFQNNSLPKWENFYERILKFALTGRRPGKFVLGTFGILVLSIVLFAVVPPKVEFFPVNEPNYVNVFVSLPIGTDIQVTNERTLEIEKEVNSILSKYMDEAHTKGIPQKERLITSIISQVGNGTSDPNSGPSLSNTPHKGRITINFSEFQYRDGVKTSEILAEIQKGLAGKFPADIDIITSKEENGPPQGSAVNIEVTGKGEYKELIQEAAKIKSYLANQNVKGVEKLKLNVESNRSEIPIKVNRELVGKLNTSTYQIGMAIRKALLGQDISTYTLDDESYDIVVRFNKKNRDNFDAILDQQLIFRNNKGELINIPIRSVIENPKETSTFSEVVRKDQIPLVAIQSNVTADANPAEVIVALKAKMSEYEKAQGLPDNIKYKFTGQAEEQEKEMAFLSKALLIAVFMILLIIVAQFNSFSTPAVIMFTVILSFIGVFLGLVISRQDFVIMMTMIGIISLAGVVVNNAIVLIDYTNLLRAEKRKELGLKDDEQLPYEVIVQLAIMSGKTRLRPVLLTAITTVLGLVPLAIGLNVDFIGLMTDYNPNIYFGGDNNIFFAPIAWTIIFGLTFATFLTLVIIPAFYLLMFKFKIWVFNLFGMKFKSNI